MKLSKKSLKNIKDNLLKIKADIEKSMSALDEEIDSAGDETDRVQARNIIEMKKKLFERDSIQLKRINMFLDSMNKEDINVCLECGEIIGEKRLLANPGTRICFDCACNNSKR